MNCRYGETRALQFAGQFHLIRRRKRLENMPGYDIILIYMTVDFVVEKERMQIWD